MNSRLMQGLLLLMILLGTGTVNAQIADLAEWLELLDGVDGVLKFIEGLFSGNNGHELPGSAVFWVQSGVEPTMYSQIASRPGAEDYKGDGLELCVTVFGGDKPVCCDITGHLPAGHYDNCAIKLHGGLPTTYSISIQTPRNPTDPVCIAGFVVDVNAGQGSPSGTDASYSIVLSGSILAGLGFPYSYSPMPFGGKATVCAWFSYYQWASDNKPWPRTLSINNVFDFSQAVVKGDVQVMKQYIDIQKYDEIISDIPDPDTRAQPPDICVRAADCCIHCWLYIPKIVHMVSVSKFFAAIQSHLYRGFPLLRADNLSMYLSDMDTILSPCKDKNTCFSITGDDKVTIHNQAVEVEGLYVIQNIP